MPRRVELITLDATAGRDKGKVFQITEMPAARVERWAVRAFLALANAGVDVPPDLATTGLAGVAQLGLAALSGLKYEAAEPLLDEMMECVLIVPDPAHPEVARRLIDDDIEEVATFLRLRKEVWTIHTGFSQAAKGFPSLTPATPDQPPS